MDLYLASYPSYMRSVKPSKENIQHFKTKNFVLFPFHMGHLC
jgi:hypothetical protein